MPIPSRVIGQINRILIFGAALIICLIVYRLFLERNHIGADEGMLPVDTVGNWQDYIRTGHLSGSDSASVFIVEFSDFECPYCTMFNKVVEEIRKRYPGRVARVYHHFPIPQLHEHALMAAVAAECAGAQDRFWAFHDFLYASQDSIGSIAWSTYADRAGVGDTAAFVTCLTEGWALERVRESIGVGERLGVRSTPTLLINELRIEGTPSVDYLTKLIRTAAASSGAIERAN